MSGWTDAVVGDYRIIEPLGRGGMATVYRGAHLESGEHVAIKMVDAPSARVVQGIRREVRALARLQHPGIVRIVGDGLHEGLPWYAMQLIEGVTLGEICRPAAPSAVLTRTLVDARRAEEAPAAAEAAGPAMSVERVVNLVRPLCASLAYLHGEGLVHRDLKPDNVIVRPGDDPVIVDFGLASEQRSRTHRERLEVRGHPAGTAAYMAPEVIRGEPVDARADLYSLGCVLYELLTGRKPFSAFTVAAVLYEHLSVTPPPLSELVAELPPALDDVVTRLLLKDPRQRLGHAEDVGRVLEELGAAPVPESTPRARTYLYRPGFVGRLAPMEALTAELGNVRKHGGSLVLVGGESGIGKTRLVNELGARATREGFTVLEGECTSEGGRPLEPFRQPLQRLADRCRERGAVEVERVFGRRGRVLAPYQSALATLPGLEAYDEPAPLSSEAARVRVLRAVTETLSALAEPLILVLDDLHWADSLTLDVLKHFMRERLDRAPIMILGTYRKEEAHDALRELLALDGAVRLDLGRLAPDDVNALMSDMLAHRASPELSDYVAAQSEGNPFFVAEYVRAAVEVGILRRDAGGRFRLDERDAVPRARGLNLPLPDTLRDVVHRRIDGLSTNAGRLLSVASVMGREMDVAALVEATRFDEALAFDALDELVRRQVLEDAPEQRVRFSHDKLREVAYDSVEGETRARLHARVAETLEAGELDEPPYDALAHHWLRAGVIDKALDALDGAGKKALDRCAYKRAADCYRQALEASHAQDPRRAEWERCCAEAALGLGDYAQGQRRLLRALSLGGAPAASNLPFRVAGMAEQAARQIVHRVVPSRFVEATGRRSALLRRTRTYQRLVETYWFENDVPRMVDAGLRALNVAERAGPSPELARAYATMCLSTGSVPIHALAEHYAALAVRIAEETGDPSARAYVLFLNSVYRVGAAKWARVESDLGRATEICREIGDSRFLGESLTVLGMASLYQGAFERADGLFGEAASSGRRFDNVQHRVWGAIGRAEAQLRKGRPNEASAQLDEAAALLSSHPQTLELLRLHGLRASVELRRGDLAAAIRSANVTAEHARMLPVPTAHYLLEGYAGLAEVRLEELRRARAEGGPARAERRAARDAVRSMRRFARLFRIGRPRAATLRASLSWISGHHETAIRAWRAAVRAAESMGMQYEAALAREREAHHIG